MNRELLILFVILLFTLVLCSFLGGKQWEGMENATTNTSYTGPNGATATLSTNWSNEPTIDFTDSSGNKTTYTQTKTEPGPGGGTISSYVSPSGLTAQMSMVSTSSATSSTIDAQTIDANGKNAVITLNVNPPTTPPPSSTSSTSSTDTTNSGTTNNGTTYDNYNHYSGSSYPSTFYGPDGGTARVIETINNNTLVITHKDGTTSIYYIDNNNSNVTTYNGDNGGTATIITDSDGNKAVKITSSNGTVVIYSSNNDSNNQSHDSSINQYSDDHVNDYNNAFTNSMSSNATANNSTGTYDSSLPPGIPKSQIPQGDEDLYILKSKVVPPVCPKCPNPIVMPSDSTGGSASGATSGNTKCPPCPPCARCPEPAFDCKKVPNYSALNQNTLPIPVLNSFSTFGM